MITAPSIHTYTQTHTYTHIHTYIHILTHTHTHTLTQDVTSSSGRCSVDGEAHGQMDRGMDNLASDDTILILDRMRDLTTRTLHLEVRNRRKCSSSIESE